MEVIQPILDWFSVEENQKLAITIAQIAVPVLMAFTALRGVGVYLGKRKRRKKEQLEAEKRHTLVNKAVETLTKPLEARDRQRSKRFWAEMDRRKPNGVTV